MKTTLYSLGIFLVASLLLGAAKTGTPLDGFDRHVDPDGSIRFSGSRSIEGLVHLGSWFVPEGEAAGFHGVYTQPEAITGFRKTGSFPDGTVLVKELRGHSQANYSTGGNVASATELHQWFVMIKDTQNRYPDHPLWGEGWGWALFKADDPTTNAATNYVTDCMGCHIPARSRDWVYSEGYPILREK